MDTVAGNDGSSHILFPTLVAQAVREGEAPIVHLAEGDSLEEDLAEQGYLATRALGEYCLDAAITDIVLASANARMAGVALRSYFRAAHNDVHRPDIHFLEADAVATMTAESLETQLRISRNSLLDKKNESVLVMDTVRRSGRTLSTICRTLARLGFQQVRSGAFIDEMGDGGEPLDFVYTTHQHHVLGDDPFGSDDGLRARHGSLYPERNDDRHLRYELTADRQAISRVIAGMHFTYTGQIGRYGS